MRVAIWEVISVGEGRYARARADLCVVLRIDRQLATRSHDRAPHLSGIPERSPLCRRPGRCTGTRPHIRPARRDSGRAAERVGDGDGWSRAVSYAYRWRTRLLAR